MAWTLQQLEAFARRTQRGPRPRASRKPRKAKSFNTRVSNIINNKIETRYIDTAISSTVPVDGTSVITPITLCAQGNDHDERTGDIIHVIGCEINGNIFQTSQQILDSKCRIILLRANKNIVVTQTGTLPTMLQLLVSDAVDSLGTIDNLQTKDFTFVWDKYFMLRAGADILADAKRSRLNIRYKKYWKPKKCTYGADTAVIGSCEKGQYFIVMMTDLASLQPRFEMNIRIFFKDN